MSYSNLTGPASRPCNQGVLHIEPWAGQLTASPVFLSRTPFVAEGDDLLVAGDPRRQIALNERARSHIHASR